MAERTGYRPETLEARLPREAQRGIWRNWAQNAQEAMTNVDSLDKLVSLIRPSSLRAANAGRLGEKFWEYRLYSIKYQLLIQAAQMRKAGADIQIGDNTYLDQQLKPHESLLFVIQTEPKPFVTETNFTNLCTVMDTYSLRELIEPYDQLDPSVKRRDWSNPEEALRRQKLVSWAKQAS